ncbi:uncharacterized protein LOC112189301 [Rosa chinensis]|uniref:uncharacterized protein LOC112189301 n=1 Tax=Rosa chinensis TaxID=74649 RepID=UPI001AD923B1|nr:uncharacterized protein LOC112189301 [Rosa chinensis]XP_040371080.1 uncharacterized protein LOC112189301 [Rosa chinensis]
MVLFKKAQVSHHRSCTKLGVMTASQRNIRPNMLIGGYRHNWDLVWDATAADPKLLVFLKSYRNFLHTESDTEKFYIEVQEIILARNNKTFDWALKAKMMLGKKAIEAARVFVEDTGLSDSLTGYC